MEYSLLELEICVACLCVFLLHRRARAHTHTHTSQTIIWQDCGLNFVRACAQKRLVVGPFVVKPSNKEKN